MAADGETSTVVRSRAPLPAAPQAHVARGYTPIVPEQPRFEPVSDPAFHAPPRSARMQPALAYPMPLSSIDSGERHLPVQYDFTSQAAAEPARANDYTVERFGGTEKETKGTAAVRDVRYLSQLVYRNSLRSGQLHARPRDPAGDPKSV